MIYSLYWISFEFGVSGISSQLEFTFLIPLSMLLLEAESVKSDANSTNASPFDQERKESASQRQSSKAPAALLNLTATFNSEAALGFTAPKPLPFVEGNNTKNTGEFQIQVQGYF